MCGAAARHINACVSISVAPWVSSYSLTDACGPNVCDLYKNQRLTDTCHHATANSSWTCRDAASTRSASAAGFISTAAPDARATRRPIARCAVPALRQPTLTLLLALFIVHFGLPHAFQGSDVPITENQITVLASRSHHAVHSVIPPGYDLSRNQTLCSDHARTSGGKSD